MTGRFKLPIQNYLITRYAITFDYNHDAEPLEHVKYNRGFYAANVWLLEEIESMKFDKPEFLQEYEAAIAAGPPRCCHSCDYYRYDDGQCLKFKQVPPREFVEMKDACDAWLHRVPF